MENRDNQTPAAGQETDISKSQSQQQPPEGAAKDGDWKDKQSDPLGSASADQGSSGESSSGQASSGQADYGSAESADSLTAERSDVEGASLNQKPEGGEADGFIGTQVGSDTSSELIEDDDNIPSDGE